MKDKKFFFCSDGIDTLSLVSFNQCKEIKTISARPQLSDGLGTNLSKSHRADIIIEIILDCNSFYDVAYISRLIETVQEEINNFQFIQTLSAIKDRAVIFMDSSNLFLGLKKLGVKADYGKLKKILSENKNLISSQFYGGIIDPPKAKRLGFLKALDKRYGYTIKTRKVKITSEGVKEKGVDILLAIEMIIYAYEDIYDTAILVSGDGDFTPVVKKVIINIYFGKKRKIDSFPTF